MAARVISPGANNPVTPEAERGLLGRGVLSLPDFVTNCGGVLGGTMEFAALGREEISAFILERVEKAVATLLEGAARRGLSPREIAVEASRRRFALTKERAETPAPRERGFRAGLLLYRWGLVPPALVRPPARRYFDRLSRAWLEV